ncbi:MAG: PHB depolymerase family esterase [Luteimonas sp.]
MTLKLLDGLRERVRKAAFKKAASMVAPDAQAITDTIQRAFASAGLDTQAGPLKGVTDTIAQALSAAGLRQPGPGDERAASATTASRNRDNVIEGVAQRVATPGVRTPAAGMPGAPGAPAPGGFGSHTFTSNAGTRTYKLYIPSNHARASDKPAPLVVMLHGCTQTPDDFAAGTRMNLLAEQHGFLVVYPAQAANANGSKCWNWFRAEDQARDRGEPAIIAGITRDVASKHRVDEQRIFVAGLSAGAAMSVILGATYPELYAAVGAHSGLAYGAAHDMPSAFGAMQGGSAPRTLAQHAVPTIVFHGDGDHTVDAKNGAAIVEQALAGRPDAARLRNTVQTGTSPRGRGYRRTVHADAAGHSLVEEWVLHGGAHAWSGGSAAGSFTDGIGPDASAEMVRFFLSQPVAGRA